MAKQPEEATIARLLKRTLAPGMVLQGEIAQQLTALGVEFPPYLRTDAEVDAICAALDAKISAASVPAKDIDQPAGTKGK